MRLRNLQAAAEIRNARLFRREVPHLRFSIRQAFIDAYDEYLIRFNQVEGEIDVEDDDFNNELALYRVINPVAYHQLSLLELKLIDIC